MWTPNGKNQNVIIVIMETNTYKSSSPLKRKLIFFYPLFIPYDTII